MSAIIIIIITYLQSLAPVMLAFFMFIIAYGAVIVFGFYAGKSGLYVILVLLIIAANIQVLKVTQYSFFNSPVALGTEFFAATYLVTDILTEIYGPRAARLGVMLGFLSMLFWTIMAITTLGYAPISNINSSDEFLLGIQSHLEAIFLPVPSLLIASLTAFLCSQFLDVLIYSKIRTKTKNKYLWLRNNVSTMISALIDNTIFSILAWIVLSSHPLPLYEVIKTYILGTYLFRVVAALFDTPFLYLAKKIIKPDLERL